MQTNLFPHLNYNIPTLLTYAQLVALKIRSTTMESELPEYADSVFEDFKRIESDCVFIRRKKGDLSFAEELMKRIGPLEGPKSELEGKKVRTFCLELLSNVEELEATKTSKEELIRIEIIKSIVRHFLEKQALLTKAGFSDFRKVVSLLAENSPEYSSLFKRHLELLDLQKGIRQRVKRRNNWETVRTFLRLGVFKNIAEIAAEAEKIGLRPIPKLPHKQTNVNLYSTFDAINLLDSEYREAGRWLMVHTPVITFRELYQSIKASCTQLELKRHGPLPEQKHIYFVCGVFPKEEYEKNTLDDLLDYNVKVKILSNHFLESYKTMMERENLPAELRFRINELANRKLGPVTEWKTPDFMSLSIFVSEGYAGTRRRPGFVDLYLPTQSTKHLNGVGPIVEVIPPYRASP